MDPAGSSLHDLFVRTKQQQNESESSDSQRVDFPTLLHSIISSYEECRTLIARLALFSPNEEIDEVSTHDIQYLSIDYLLAESLLKSYNVNRQQTLERVSELLDSFLARLDQYGILSDTDRRLYERFRENRRSFSLVGDANAEDRRNIKISRFQEEKSLRAKLQYLRDQSQRNSLDDETTRSLYLAELALYAAQTFQSLDMVSQELSILSHARFAEPSRQLTAHGSTNGQQDGYSDRLDDLSSLRTGGPLLSKSGKPLQPFVLTDKRTQLRRDVFRPGHSLPTMSIDEYLEEEKRRGGIIDGGGNANERPAEVDEDNTEYADAQTMKARDWDEFVEANPKGAGNRLNRG